MASSRSRSFEEKYRYTVPSATSAAAATSRICTASKPPSAASSKVAASTRRRRSAWLRARVLSGNFSPGAGLASVVTMKLKHVSIRATRTGPARLRRMADAAIDILDLADKLFTGEAPIASHHPFASSGTMAEVQPRVAFVDAFANSAVVDTDDGLVAIDTSGVFHARHVHDTVRAWSP